MTLKSLRWSVVFLLAAGLRFLLLNTPPLDDREATLALQALALAQGGHPLLRPELAYLFPTAVFFWLFSAAEWTARLWPALAGLSLPLAVWVLRRDLGEDFAFWLGLGLALDPFLVAASRRADGTMLGIAALAWLLVALRRSSWLAAGALGMLALMSGTSLWLAALAVLLTALLLLSLAYEHTRLMWNMGRMVWRASPGRLRQALAGALTVLAAAAVVHPPAAGAWAQALPDFIAGWRQLAVLPPVLFIWAVPVYGLLPFGLVVASRIFDRLNGRRDFFSAGLASLAFFIAFVVVFYPLHQPVDLAWMSLPAWWIGAGFLTRLQPHLRMFRLPQALGVLVTVTVTAFSWLQFLAVQTRFYGDQTLISIGAWQLTIPETAVQILVWLVGWLILLISLLLIATTWGAAAAWQGFGLGALVVLLVYTLGMAWSPTGMRTANGLEFWQAEGQVVGAPLLRSEIARRLNGSGYAPADLQVRVDGVPWPSAAWAVRDWMPMDGPSLAALTLTDRPPADAAQWRGTPLRWLKRPVWPAALDLSGWLRWAMLRQVSTYPETIVFWVNPALFPDAQNVK